jgi:hypothetical protein
MYATISSEVSIVVFFLLGFRLKPYMHFLYNEYDLYTEVPKVMG